MKCSLLCCRYLNFFFYLFYSLKDPTNRIAPTIDGHFITKPVDELFRTHELLTIPFMTGVNNDEGGFLLANVRYPYELMKTHFVNSLLINFEMLIVSP